MDILVKLEKAINNNTLTDEEEKLLNQCLKITSCYRKNKIKYGNFLKCYMCDAHANEVMCDRCHRINLQKREATYNLTGKVAVVTGGRIKIGYYTALYLLRYGATVVITTRFVDDAHKRYAKEADFEVWRERLFVVQCDFLYLSRVDKFINWLKLKFTHIDYLVNNAAQTLARPKEFYNYLSGGDSNKRVGNGKKYEVTNYQRFFPVGQLDEHHQQIDLRPSNSFVESIEEIKVPELVDVMTINCVVPFYIIQQLIPLLTINTNKDTATDFSYIINASSMEGKFNRELKTHMHPHTNMAKASLNMITRTCGAHLKKNNGIILVSVDTGWNTIEEPLSYHLKSPIDCIDGAVRLLDPICNNLTTAGVFYKDFCKTSW